MVLCLHQGNIHIKRKLRVWRAQKCIFLVGAKSLLTCAGHHTTQTQWCRYKAGSGNLRKLCVDLSPMWTHYLHQGNIYIKRKLWVWRDQKCILLVGAKTSLTSADRQTTPSHESRYRDENRNLRKFWWTYRHGNFFAPRQYSHQKEATSIESPEMYFLIRCKKPSYLCMP